MSSGSVNKVKMRDNVVYYFAQSIEMKTTKCNLVLTNRLVSNNNFKTYLLQLLLQRRPTKRLKRLMSHDNIETNAA